MSFFTLSDGNVASDDKFEMGGSMAPIPKDTELLSAIDEAKWDEYQGEQYISLRWSVMQPQEYANRKVFQKVKINNADTATADKAKRMLFAIDMNAGGKIAALGRVPADQDLMMALCNKPMIIKVGVWESYPKGADGKDDKTQAPTKNGNWVQAVSPRNGNVAQVAPKPNAQPDNTIPF